MKTLKSKGFLLILLFSISSLIFSNEWNHSSGSYKSERYISENQINQDNIKDLQVIWEYSSGKVYKKMPVQSSPIYTGSRIISRSPKSVFALDPISGSLIWEAQLKDITMAKGITFSKEPAPRIFVPTVDGVLEIDEKSGKILGNFNSGGTAVPPIIHDGKVIIATLEDGIKSFDLNSREQIWHLSLEKNGYKARVWSGFSFDVDTQLAFVVTGSSGGLTGWYRNEPNLESSLIAFNIKTGEIEWMYQHIKHDIWDLDVVSNPIIFKLKKDNVQTKAVLALSKTGDIILLNALNGKPIHENSFETISVEKSDVPGEKTSPFQRKILVPEPFSNTLVDLDNDLNHLDSENELYVKQKLRHATSGIFLPPSLNKDIIIYGIHGGANWPGGSIDFSSQNPSLIVPFNKDPWILRSYYTDKLNRLVEVLLSKYQSLGLSSRSSNEGAEKIYQQKCASCHEGGQAPSRMFLEKIPTEDIYYALTEGIMASQAENLSKDSKKELAEYLGKERQEFADSIFTSLPFIPKNNIYNENCSSCHGLSRRGYYEFETEGDTIYPPLVGVSLTDKASFVNNFKKVKSLHEYFDISYSISEKDHNLIFKEFSDYDARLNRFGLLSSRGFWQMLLDKNGLPATKPPWGGIAKTDLVTGKQLWSIPFGSRVDEENKTVANGDKSFGGVLSTASGLIFATGTPDPKVYAYNSEGKQIWSDKIPFAGSAPPMSFLHNGCQFVLITSTGGRFVPFKENGDQLIAYKLNSCKFNENVISN